MKKDYFWIALIFFVINLFLMVLYARESNVKHKYKTENDSLKSTIHIADSVNTANIQRKDQDSILIEQYKKIYH